MLRENFNKWGPHAGKMVPKSSGGGFSISRELKHEKNDSKGNTVAGGGYQSQTSTNYQWQPSTNSQSQPVANYQSQPTTNYQWKPPTSNQSQPTVNYQWQPPTNNQSQSAATLQPQPLANFQSQPAANFQSQPLANFQFQPAANFQSQPLGIIGQMLKNDTGQPRSWHGGNQAGVANNKSLMMLTNVNKNENVQRSQNNNENLGMQGLGNADAMLESRLAKTRGSMENQRKAKPLISPGRGNANAILESRLAKTKGSTENQCNGKPLGVPGNANSMLESRLAKTRGSTAKAVAIPDRGLGVLSKPVNPSPNQVQSKQGGNLGNDNQSNRKRKASRWDNNKPAAQDTQSNSVTNIAAKRPLLSKPGGSIADTMLQARLAKANTIKNVATPFHNQNTNKNVAIPFPNQVGKLMATQTAPPQARQPLMNTDGRLRNPGFDATRGNNSNAPLDQFLHSLVRQPNNIPQQLQIAGPVHQPNNVPQQLQIVGPVRQPNNVPQQLQIAGPGQQNRNLAGPPVALMGIVGQNNMGNSAHPIQQHVAQQIQKYTAQEIANKIREALPKPVSLMEIALPGNKQSKDLYSNFKGSEKFKTKNINEKGNVSIAAKQITANTNKAVKPNNAVAPVEAEGEAHLSKKARKRARKRAAKEDGKGGNVNIGVARVLGIKSAEQQMKNAKAELTAKKIALETNKTGSLFNPPVQGVNRPLLQGRNVLPLQGLNRPFLQGGNRPPLPGGIRPPLQGGNMLPLLGGNRPPLQGGNRPPLQGGNRPPLQGGNRPPLQGRNRPPLQGGNRPPLQGGNRPPLQGGNRPPLQGGNRPPLQIGNQPRAQVRNQHPIQIGNRPPAQGGNQPRMQVGNWQPSQIGIRPRNLIGNVIPLIANTGGVNIGFNRQDNLPLPCTPNIGGFPPNNQLGASNNQILRKLVDNTVDALMGIPNQRNAKAMLESRLAKTNNNLDFNRTGIQLPPNVPASNIPNFKSRWINKQKKERTNQAQKGISKSEAERREKANKKSTVIDLTSEMSDQEKKLNGGDSPQMENSQEGEDDDMDFNPDDDTDEPMYTVADDTECSEFGLLGLLPQAPDSSKNDESGGTSSLVEFTGKEDLIYSNYSGTYKAKKKENEKGNVESKGKENLGKPLTVNARLAALRKASENRKQLNTPAVGLNNVKKGFKKKQMRNFKR